MNSTKPQRLLELQQSFMDLCERGTGRAKSATLDSLMEQLAAAVRAGFQKRELWDALCEVGYEGSYDYFTKKLTTSGVIRKRTIVFLHRSQTEQFVSLATDCPASPDSIIGENRTPPPSGSESDAPVGTLGTPETHGTVHHGGPVPSESVGPELVSAEKESKPEWQVRRESVLENLRLEEERAEQLRQELAKKDTGFKAPEFKPPQR